MAGYIPAPYKPVPINVAAGASAGRLFTGTGPDAATWKALPVAPAAGRLGDVGGTVAAILGGLQQIGVPLPDVRDWDQGMKDGGRQGRGWYSRYSSDNVSAASAGLVTGGTYPAALGAVHDPLARGVSGDLLYQTGGGARIWPAGSFFRIYWRKPDNALAEGGGSVGYGSAVGEQFTFGPFDSFLANWKYLGMAVTDGNNVVLHKSYQE